MYFQSIVDASYSPHEAHTSQHSRQLVRQDWPSQCNDAVVCGDVQRSIMHPKSAELRTHARNQDVVGHFFMTKQRFDLCSRAVNPIAHVARHFAGEVLRLVPGCCDLVLN